jgi:hypothetical protein
MISARLPYFSNDQKIGIRMVASSQKMMFKGVPTLTKSVKSRAITSSATKSAGSFSVTNRKTASARTARTKSISRFIRLQSARMSRKLFAARSNTPALNNLTESARICPVAQHFSDDSRRVELRRRREIHLNEASAPPSLRSGERFASVFSSFRIETFARARQN